MIDSFTLKTLFLRGEGSAAAYHIRKEAHKHPYLEVIADLFDDLFKNTFATSIALSNIEFENLEQSLRNLCDSLDDAQSYAERSWSRLQELK